MSIKSIVFILLLVSLKSLAQGSVTNDFLSEYKLSQKKLSNSQPPQQQVNVAFLDISFFGYKILLNDNLSADINEVKSNISSPHGTGVVQTFYKPFIPAIQQNIKVGYMGIIGMDVSLETHLNNIFSKGIRLVNISYYLKNKEDIKLLNNFIDKGLIVVLSAGNYAERRGPDIAEHYYNFKGLIASSIDDSGKIAPFSQTCSTCIHVLGGIGQYGTKFINHTNFDKREGEPELSDLNNGNITYLNADFGMTSSAAPMLSSVVAITLIFQPEVSIQAIQENLLSTSNFEIGLHKLNVNNYLLQLTN